MKPLDTLSDAEFIAAMRRAVRELPDAPAPWQRAAVALFPAAAPGARLQAAVQAAVQVATRSLLRRVEAALSFDSWATPGLATGMRSSRSATRHLLFSAEGRDVDLRIRPVDDRWSLSGQILGPDDRGAIEVQPGGGQPPQRVELDATGEFHLDGLDRGTYTVTLQLGADEVVLPPIDVGDLPA